MRIKPVFSILMTVIALFVAILANAATVPAWQIVPKESSIQFTATQNNAPISGNFKTFSGDIVFDPAQLAASHIRIVVDPNSVSTSYQEVEDTLRKAEWFDVKAFPQAVFTSNKFTKTGNKNYQVQGTLTLRDKSIPVILDFVVGEFSANHFNAKGTTTLKRTLFGVGQGEWAKTDAVKDEVKVDFVLVTTRKN